MNNAQAPKLSDILTIEEKVWPTAGVFRLSRGGRTEVRTVQAKLTHEGITGKAEAVPYARYDESIESVRKQIDGLMDQSLTDITHARLLDLLPPGAARNLIDCVLWDWEAKRLKRPVWQMLNLMPPEPVTCTFTLSLDEPLAMAEAALKAKNFPTLKIKLGTPNDLPRLEAVHMARPEAQIIVDANEGWSAGDLAKMAGTMMRLGVVLCEQPLRAGEDEALRGMRLPFPLCADESAHTTADLPNLRATYQAVNVKLDKAGGLHAAYEMMQAARVMDFKIMIGCMVASSLAMAPAVLLAPLADWVDLDGPLLLAEDHAPPLVYNGSVLHPPRTELWG